MLEATSIAWIIFAVLYLIIKVMAWTVDNEEAFYGSTWISVLAELQLQLLSGCWKALFRSCCLPSRLSPGDNASS